MTNTKEIKDLTNPFLNNVEIPTLDTQTANQLLENVFAACDCEPSTIPVEVLESWGNYKRPKFNIGRGISYIFVLVLILLPMMFFTPTVIAERTNVHSSRNALYNIKVQTLLPIHDVSATLDGKPINISRTSAKNYTVELTKNGILTINAVSFNGQIGSSSYEVVHIDTDKPKFIDSYSKNGYVYLSVADTYTGIDYENITGLTPESYDEEKGLLVFKMPSTSATVTIPDKAGNELVLLLSQVE